MAIRVAIHGMGVVGRELLRTLFSLEGYEVVMLSDLVQAENLAYLLKYDTLYHDWEYRDSVECDDNSITIAGKSIPLYTESDIKNLPLHEREADLVIDCSGSLTSKAKLQGFIDAGARKVMACYYIGNDVPNIVYGVNQNVLTWNDTIFSFASMETQVLANILKPINDGYTVNTAFAKAFRSYTNVQPTIDSYNKNLAQGRAAAWNITPLSDTFAKQIGLTVPELNGKVRGFAYRAPIINGSMLDVTAVLENPTTTSDINTLMKSKMNAYFYSDESLCSSDAMSFDFPVFLANSTMAQNIDDGKTMLSVTATYDSVRGYCYLIKRFLEEAISDHDSWIY